MNNLRLEEIISIYKRDISKNDKIGLMAKVLEDSDNKIISKCLEENREELQELLDRRYSVIEYFMTGGSFTLMSAELKLIEDSIKYIIKNPYQIFLDKKYK